MTQLTVEQATNRLGALVDAAMNGEEVVLVRGDQGAVRLVPVSQSTARPRFGSAKGLISMSEDFDAPLDEFRPYMEPGE